MSSQNKRPTTSSRQARPRALTTLTPHLSDTRGLVSDRISRARSHSTQASRLSERQQLAILDAVVSSGAFQIPQYSSTNALLKSDPGHASVDPSALNLGPTDVLLPTSRSPVPSVAADSGSAGFVESSQLGDEALDLSSVGRHNMSYGHSQRTLDHADLDSAATYMLPSYGHMDPYNQHYQTGYQAASYVSEDSQNASRATPPVTSSYAPNYTTSPSMMKDSPRLPQQQLDTRPHRSSFTSSYHSANASPYLASASPGQPTYGFQSPAGRTSQFTSHTPSSHGQDPTSASYTSAYSLPQASYGANSYDSAFQSIQTTSAGYVPTHSATAYLGSQGYVVPSSADLVSGGAAEDSSGVRILNSRPKPQCWDHGCNGRQFSTFSNLLRHQREKSGTAAKSVCPRCGAEFTRTTARNGHMAHDKCKRKSSNSSVGGE